MEAIDVTNPSRSWVPRDSQLLEELAKIWNKVFNKGEINE